MGLPEAVLLADQTLHLEVASDVVVLEDVLDTLVDVLGAAPCTGLDQALVQGFEIFRGGADQALSPSPLVEGEQRAPHPGDGPDLHGGNLRLEDVPAVPRSVTVAAVGTVPHQLPVRRMGLDPLAELSVLLARARHHGDEASAGAVDILHVFERTKF